MKVWELAREGDKLVYTNPTTGRQRFQTVYRVGNNTLDVYDSTSGRVTWDFAFYATDGGWRFCETTNVKNILANYEI